LSSIIAAIITKQAWVCMSKPSPFLSWCRSGRPAPVRRGVLSFYGGLFPFFAVLILFPCGEIVPASVFLLYRFDELKDSIGFFRSLFHRVLGKHRRALYFFLLFPDEL
jgi:hypothetical protein